MKNVTPLRYGTIFKKAFSDLEIFTAFVEAVLNIQINVEKVEMEKSFGKAIRPITPRFDLYAEDLKNRIIVDIQHERLGDHYARFLYYHMVAILEQSIKSNNYNPALTVYTIVVLTSGDHHKKDVVVIKFDPEDLDGNPLGEITHKIVYLCPKYRSHKTPSPYREWMEAIDDSLDGVVDETHYTIPLIQKLFDQIEEDQLTPDDRAKMIEEQHEDELTQKSFQEGVLIGEAKGKESGIALGKEQGMIEILLSVLPMLVSTRYGEQLPDGLEEQLTRCNLAALQQLKNALTTCSTLQEWLKMMAGLI